MESHGKHHSVEGSTILVLGLGDIGGDYARKVHALGAHVIGVRRTNRNKPDYLDEQHTMDDLDMLLGRQILLPWSFRAEALRTTSWTREDSA